MNSQVTNEALLATVSRRLSRMLDLTGVRDRGLDVLGFVFEGESVGVPSDMTALTAHLEVSRGTAYAIVDDLVARGLLTKGVDPNSRRRTLLRLTDEGERTIRATLERCVADLLGIADAIKRMAVRPRLIGTVTLPSEADWLPPIRWLSDWYHRGMDAFVPLNFLGRLNVFDARPREPRDFVLLVGGPDMLYANGAKIVGQTLATVLRHYDPDLREKVYESYREAMRTGAPSVHQYEIALEGRSTAYQRICLPLGSPPDRLMTVTFFVDMDVGPPQVLVPSTRAPRRS